MLSKTSLAQPTSQELLWSIRCVRCKKPIVVDSLAKRTCKDCLVEKTRLYRWAPHLNWKKELTYVQSCLFCNYIYLSRYKKSRWCSLSCSGKAYRERKRKRNHAV
ncbi:hypothetical protein LCGC14_2186600 [marine sediment metagenome]|uniref:Uncharacterized protein n=1 Tax=marine sediment metagenome TaxID=412755 RepID=A0A0F9FY86_9ZZZZ